MTDVAERDANAAVAPELVLELVHSERDARRAVDALAEVWVGPEGQKPLPAELAWVFAHTGNYVVLAKADDHVVGAAIGFRGVDEEGVYLHSHIAGVVPEWQGASIGFALKQHQRSWAMAEGLDRICWTFDPLVARNAYFNVMKLGAEITGYHVDFYGPMSDGVNTGDETDRCVVSWRLTSPRVLAAAAGEGPVIDLDALRRRGAQEVLSADVAGRPLVLPAMNASILLVEVPGDAVELRRTDPQRALAWRRALRDVLVPAFADGQAVVGVTRDSHYVLANGPLDDVALPDRLGGQA